MGRPGNLGAAAVRTRAQRLTGASDWTCTACRWAVGGALERADAESEDAEAEATIARHRSGGSVGYQPSCGKHRMFCMGGGCGSCWGVVRRAALAAAAAARVGAGVKARRRWLIMRAPSERLHSRYRAPLPSKLAVCP